MNEPYLKCVIADLTEVCKTLRAELALMANRKAAPLVDEQVAEIVKEADLNWTERQAFNEWVKQYHFRYADTAWDAWQARAALAAPAPKPLTDEQIDAMYARAIEIAHEIKQ